MPACLARTRLAGGSAAAASMYQDGVGVGINANSKDNQRLSSTQSSRRIIYIFRASQTSTITAIRVTYRADGDNGSYSDGDGGSHNVDVYAVDGNLEPTGSAIGTGISGYAPGVGFTESWPTHTVSIPVTAGSLYCVSVWNVHASQSTNHVSLNNLLAARTQRAYTADFKLRGSSDGTTAWNELSSANYPHIDIEYANGEHDGQRHGISRHHDSAAYGIIDGTNWVREEFVKDGDLVITNIYLWGALQTGTGTNTVELLDGSDNVLRSGTFSITDWPSSTPGVDPATGGEVTIPITAYTLTDGTTYRVRVKRTSGTGSSWMWPLSAASVPAAWGSRLYTGCSDSVWQRTSNSGGAWNTPNQLFNMLWWAD